MDETDVNRTRAAINALIDVEQLWIENTPDYRLSPQEVLTLKKRLEGAQKNIKKILEDNKELIVACESEIMEKRQKTRRKQKKLQ